MTVLHDGVAIDWLGYATVRLEGPDGSTVYLDPGRYGVLTGEWTPDAAEHRHPPARDYRPNDADLVVVTHDHHYDSDGIDRVAHDGTTIGIYEAVEPRFIDRDVSRVVDLPGETVRLGEHDDRLFGDVIVRTVPAYNDPDGPRTTADGEPFHPEGFGVGVYLTIDDTRIFWPGDSDVLDGHGELDVDVFLPPIGGSFTMDRHEAADLAVALDPDLVVPIHYDTFTALQTDAEAFAAALAEQDVVVHIDDE